MAETSNNFSDLLRQYADSWEESSTRAWTLADSLLGGRGLFAKRALAPGSEVFRESALLLGPRADPRCPIVCVGCHHVARPGSRLRSCSRGCGLPVCGEQCEGVGLHKECSLFQKLHEELGVRDRLALVAPLRAVFLAPLEREVLIGLEGHERPEHNALVQRMKSALHPEALKLFQICCQVLDATAFETSVLGGSIRGIYPLAALMNHDCVPNTRHCFDTQGRMVVETTRPVAEGEELTTTYTCLTWGTQARRSHLQATKRFMCRCRRCKDPSEFGSQLMALYCMKKGCGGVLLPSDGEASQLPWSCANCATRVPSLRISVIQRMVGGEISKIEGGNPREACRVLCKNTLVPGSNHTAVEFKLSLVRLYGNEKGFTWPELSADDLVLKQLVCVELILLFSLLGLGLCRQRGLLLLELAETLKELQKRIGRGTLSPQTTEIPYYGSIAEIYSEASGILRHDASAKAALLKSQQALLQS